MKISLSAIALPKVHQVQQAGVYLLIAAMIGTVESKSILGAYHAQPDHIAGIQMAMISGLCALLAFIAFALIGAIKADIRYGSFIDEVRRPVHSRVFWTRVIAIAFMITPIGFLGSALKMDRLEAHYAAYEASPRYAADVALMSDMSADRYEREEAMTRNAKPVTPDLTIVDGEFWIAAFLLTLLNFAGEVIRIPAPATEEERQHIRRLEIAAKSLATRRRNQARRQAAAAARAAKIEKKKGGLLSLLQGGKS